MWSSGCGVRSESDYALQLGQSRGFYGTAAYEFLRWLDHCHAYDPTFRIRSFPHLVGLRRRGCGRFHVSSDFAYAESSEHGEITFTEVNVDGPYIAMTFDDGPHATNTQKLLEMAAERHIKLTFFVLGECVEKHPDVLRREVAEGHEIGNHSWSHPNLAKLSDADVRSQLRLTEDIIVKTAGIKPRLMRPPYGELTKRQRILVNHEFGYKVILWDVDPLDWKRPGSDIVAQRIIAGTRPGSIILSHDIHPPTIAAMPQVFDGLLAKGFKFVTVSELLVMDKGGERKPSK